MYVINEELDAWYRAEDILKSIGYTEWDLFYRHKEFALHSYEALYQYCVNKDQCTKLYLKSLGITIPEFKFETVRLATLVLAESVALDAFEQEAEKALNQSLYYSKRLMDKGAYITDEKELLKFIGFAATMRQEILSNLYISISPDYIWDDDNLDKIFKKLSDLFDIEERFRSLNMTLNSIQESIEIMIDLLQNKKSHKLEWMIIILILIEILISIVWYLTK
jgi:uncharacterized Rmd1/YagE family protein